MFDADRVEEAAIALAFFNRGPRVPDNVTPRGYWKSWQPEAKAAYRRRVLAVFKAFRECDADAAFKDNT